MSVYIIVGCFILFDILTGITKALYAGVICSTKLRKGLYHKLSEIISVVGAGLLEIAIQYVDIGVDIPILNTVVIYICVMELTSNLENLSEINPQLFSLFKPYLEKLKGSDNNNERDN